MHVTPPGMQAYRTVDYHASPGEERQSRTPVWDCSLRTRRGRVEHHRLIVEIVIGLGDHRRNTPDRGVHLVLLVLLVLLGLLVLSMLLIQVLLTRIDLRVPVDVLAENLGGVSILDRAVTGGVGDARRGDRHIPGHEGIHLPVKAAGVEGRTASARSRGGVRAVGVEGRTASARSRGGVRVAGARVGSIHDRRRPEEGDHDPELRKDLGSESLHGLDQHLGVRALEGFELREVVGGVDEAQDLRARPPAEIEDRLTTVHLRLDELALIDPRAMLIRGSIVVHLLLDGGEDLRRPENLHALLPDTEPRLPLLLGGLVLHILIPHDFEHPLIHASRWYPFLEELERRYEDASRGRGRRGRRGRRERRGRRGRRERRHDASLASRAGSGGSLGLGSLGLCGGSLGLELGSLALGSLDLGSLELELDSLLLHLLLELKNAGVLLLVLLLSHLYQPRPCVQLPPELQVLLLQCLVTLLGLFQLAHRDGDRCRHLLDPPGCEGYGDGAGAGLLELKEPSEGLHCLLIALRGQSSALYEDERAGELSASGGSDDGGGGSGGGGVSGDRHLQTTKT